MVGLVLGSRALVFSAALVVLGFSACGGTSVRGPDAQAGSSGEAGADRGAGGAGAMGGQAPSAGSGTVSGGSGASGASGTGGTAPSLTCDSVRKRAAEELERIQSCRVDSDCGLVLPGTSCGCTRDLVARTDADPGPFEELLRLTIEGERCVSLGSDCDCPSTYGFACEEGRCSWDYTGTPSPMCISAPIGSLCVEGFPIGSGDQFNDGIPLMVRLRPVGCFSSSCTRTVSASCAIEADGDDYLVKGDICLSREGDPGVGCTDDCGGGADVYCETDHRLSEGIKTVRYEGEFSLSVTFTVPSIVTDPAELCDVRDL
jgi:hypothetical protein